MKTELSYFGNWKDSSKIGTIRHLILLIPTTLTALIINVILFPDVELEYQLLSSIFIAIWLASALGVQNSIDLIPTITYASLVFFVVYACIAGTLALNNNIKIDKLAIATVTATILGGLNGLLIYYTGPVFKYLK
jgi:hypothetical protein